jgi:hypothetical protein
MGARLDGGVITDRVDHSCDFVARSNVFRVTQGPVLDMQIGSADTAGRHADPHPAGRRLGQIDLPGADGSTLIEYR